MATYGTVTVGELLSDRALRREVASVLGKAEGDLLRAVSDLDDTTSLESIYDNPVPDDLEYKRVSWVRGNTEAISRISKYTGLPIEKVDSDLNSAHGSVLVTNLFTFIWIERPSVAVNQVQKAKPAKRELRRETQPAPIEIASTRKKPSSRENKVFLVHGHDEAAKETVARFLEKLRLTVVILHEQPSRGRTIIEKFEEHSDVTFAVVLLTPDDVGHSARSEEVAHRRARQNVVFELGYFIGRLGRHRVCALHKSSLELPSDYSGIVYIQMDGAWKFELAKELKQVFPSVDMNGAI